jgi:alpha/beta hydrolase fold
MKRLLVLALAASLSTGVALAGPALAATGTTSAAATQTISAASSIKWGPCSDPDLDKAHAQCGDLQVPLDYDQPDGQQISLAVSRVMHTSPAADYQGVMLVNPGGPGGSGLGLSVLGQFVPNHAGDAYDWIGFDPRGVGSSKPSLSCLPTTSATTVPTTSPRPRSLSGPGSPARTPTPRPAGPTAGRCYPT